MATFPKHSFAARLLALPPEEALKAFGTGTPDEYRSLEFEDNHLTAHLFAGALVAAVREGVVCE